jgi:glycerate kinase
MRVVLAPNALKGSCSAAAAADAMAEGVLSVDPGIDIVKAPVADGGDGLLAVAAEVIGAELRRFQVTGPDFDPVQAVMGWEPRTRCAVVEMALASGLALLDGRALNPEATTTVGTGELLRAALDLGAERIIIGIGGSATNDGGIGMASALGWRFLDEDGASVPPTGGGLSRIQRVDGTGVDRRLSGVRIDVICDVDNPLAGPNGASRVFAPQKGASVAQVQRLDRGLQHLADVVARELVSGYSGLPHAQPELSALPGAGAAGGLGFGLVAFCGARLRPGADVVLDMVDFDGLLEEADLVLTSEGRIDSQTAAGKAPAAVAARAHRIGLPCIAIAGGLGEGYRVLHEIGVEAAFSLCPGPIGLEEAQAQARTLLSACTEQVIRLFLAGHRAGRSGRSAQTPKPPASGAGPHSSAGIRSR